MNAPFQIGGAIRGASVLFPVEPKLDESIRGYLARAADWNCFDSRADLLRLSGITYVRRDLSDRIAAEITAVSDVLGVRSEALRRTLNPTIGGDPEVVEYFGLPFPRRRFEFKNRRVSPASLRVSPHHRARWQIKLLPFCPESWEYLIDTCPSEACGKPLRWGDCLEIDRCEHCEFDLKSAMPACVSAGLREALGFVGDLVHPSPDVRVNAAARLPEPLCDVPGNELFEVLCVLTRSFTPEHLKSSARLDTDYLALAAQALLDYPLSFDRIAQEGREMRDPSIPPLFVRLRRRAKEKSSLQRALILSMVDRAETIHAGPTRVAKMQEEEGEWTFHRSATWLGIKLSEFQKVVDAGFAKRSPRRGRARDIRWIKPSEVHAVGARLRQRLAPEEFVRTYGIPLSGMEQLVSLGLIGPCTDPVAQLLYQGFELDRVSVLGFVDRIAEVLAPPLPDSVALEDVFYGIGGREKPWGAVLAAALAGHIPGGLGLDFDAKLRFERLTIPRQFAWDLLAGRYPDFLALPVRLPALGPTSDFSRVEAQRHLNCFPRDLDWLLSKRHLSARAYGRGIGRCAVEALGRELISSREISWRWRISPEMREDLPARYGLGRALGPFWCRREVEERFAATFEQQSKLRASAPIYQAM